MASFLEGILTEREPRYAELQVTTNFSFLRGAAHPDELVVTAAALGHAAIAITDRNSLAGIVRAHHAAKEVGLRLVVGCRLDLRDGTSLLAFPEDRAAYGRLTRLLTLGKRRAPKGECHLDYADVVAYGAGQIIVVLPPPAPSPARGGGLGWGLRLLFERAIKISPPAPTAPCRIPRRLEPR
jgi:error-prone DNA polymerase